MVVAGAGPSGVARVWLSWSSGKDSAYALEVLRRDPRYEVVGLLTTVTSDFGRVSIHGVREELLDRQAREIGLPLVKVPIPYPCPNEVYEAAMRRALGDARHDGVRHVAFGDLFLEDVRAYRETRMAAAEMVPLFPLWHRPTPELARTMIADGLNARICCLDPRAMPPELAGRRFDAALLDELPATVDPCGERGEFHTFVTRSRAFASDVPVRVGEIVTRDGFVYADLIPTTADRLRGDRSGPGGPGSAGPTAG